MKKIVFIILLNFIVIMTATANEINLPFTKDSGQYWQYISDQTMGGISNGKATLEKDGEKFFARLTGNVSTENNGGFIQLRSSFSFSNFEKNEKKIKGLRLNVRGNNETYHIFVRTDKTRSYRDYYSVTFIADSNWKMIDLPFDKFKHRVSNNQDLQGNNIRSIGIVAYGRDFESDISISEIILYY